MCDTSRRPALGSNSSRPRWGVLYAMTVLQITALAVVEASQASHPIRTALRCAVALGIFVATGAWLHVSRAALDLQNWCDCAGERMTVRVIQSYRPEPAPDAVTAMPVPGKRETPVPVAKEEEALV